MRNMPAMILENKLSVDVRVEVEVEPVLIVPANSKIELQLIVKKITIGAKE
jgi:5-formaminoimidazole-4-carboxamide-1-beta-D-ribofuranosyl 5'-monophosphate synthetase